jgi:hypothetical protein
MMQAMRRALLPLAITLLTLAPLAAGQHPDVQSQPQDLPAIQRRIPEAARTGPVAFARTELYFGTAKPDGVVTPKEFRKFIDDKVTPRFPDGLTLLRASGQFRGEDDVIVKERSFVLILLYPSEGFVRSSQKIERIRTLYKEQFNQQSVLRVDDPYLVWVSF